MNKDTELYNEDENEPLNDSSEKIYADDSNFDLETDEQAKERLREFENSINGSFKRTVILSAIILGVAAALGIVLSIVL